MTPSPSEHLRILGRRVLEAHRDLPGAACAAITGSAAEGLADQHSDLDMTVYYDGDKLPSEADLARIRERLGASDLIWALGDRAEGDIAQSFRIGGVECQIGHITVAKWESDMAETLAGRDPGGPLHKAMSGTLASVAVFGEPHLRTWQARLREYPRSLREAMARHHLEFFAIWGVVERLETRDAELWVRQSLVDSSFKILGVLAGINRRYFTSFQFKRKRTFIDSLEVAPADLAARLEELWRRPFREAAESLRQLVREVADLVEKELPEVDTKACRRALARDDRPWRMSGSEAG
jgi:hypothetical protein